MDYLDEIENEVQAYFATHYIPTYFYQCLFGELIKIWGINLVTPYYIGDTYEKQIDEHIAMITGTGGWNVAFKSACEQCDMMDVNEYYKKLDWIESDIFDGIIADNMVKILFSENVGHDWYHYRLRKENNNE